MRFDVVTLFPEMIVSAMAFSIVRRALENGLISLSVWNPRDFATDKHRTVDDRPYGGGPGMVMKYQPLHDAVYAAKSEGNGDCKVVYLSPQGKPVTQALLAEVAKNCSRLILVAGRYEGVDERFVEQDCSEEWSIGDYVLTGGELAALVVIDGIARLLPGVLGAEESIVYESHMTGLLDFPHYTRPEHINGMSVPKVLLNGNHAEIAKWQMQQSLERTWLKRPDLLANKKLTDKQDKLLQAFKNRDIVNKQRCCDE